MHSPLRRLTVALLFAALPAAAGAGEADVYGNLLAELTALEGVLPQMELSFYGTSAGGRRLPFAVVNRDRQFTAKRLARTGRPLVLILAGAHGDEPDGAGIVIRLLRELHGGAHPALLDGANYLLVPALDVDGLPGSASAGRHGTLAGLDLDRDWLKLEAEETRSLVTIVAGWKPHLVIDLHGRAETAAPGDGGAVLRRPPAAVMGSEGSAWLDKALSGRGEIADDPRPGSSLGYFSLRRIPVLRVDAAAADDAYRAVLDVLAAVAADPDALKRAVAADLAPSPPAEIAGYVVEPGWQRIERALRGHGIAGERLTEPQKLVVERLFLDLPSFAARPREGLFRVMARVRAEQGVRVLPAGSLWVPADQPLGAVVRELLEPAAPESLVSWGLLSSVFGEDGSEHEAPILRATRRPAGETRSWH